MDRRGFLGWLAALAPVGVFGLPEVKAAPAPMIPINSDIVTRKVAQRELGDIDAFIPELWEKRYLEILQQSMVTGGLVQRDYDHRDISQWNERIRVGR